MTVLSSCHRYLPPDKEYCHSRLALRAGLFEIDQSSYLDLLYHVIMEKTALNNGWMPIVAAPANLELELGVRRRRVSCAIVSLPSGFRMARPKRQSSHADPAHSLAALDRQACSIGLSPGIYGYAISRELFQKFTHP